MSKGKVKERAEINEREESGYTKKLCCIGESKSKGEEHGKVKGKGKARLKFQDK